MGSSLRLSQHRTSSVCPSFLITLYNMRRQRQTSYSSSTLSSTSSRSSDATYASIESTSTSGASRSSAQLQSSNFWSKFDRKTKSYSVLSVLKSLFKHKEREKGEPSKLSKQNLQVYHISPVISHPVETSFNDEIPAHPKYSSSGTCPVGLYCVIEDFLTEYYLRLLEEE